MADARRRLLACVFAATLLAGCGEASESSEPTVTQRVTRDFGHERVPGREVVPLAGHRTAMRLLKAEHEVETTPDGNFIDAIDGLRERNGRSSDTLWVLNVNGVEADEFPPKYPLFPGDVVQWDLRDWYVTLDVRATVGAFPQTFTRGVFGKRFPVTVECARPSSSACARVKATLRTVGVAPDGSRPRGGLPPHPQPQRAEVLVGPWRHWRDRPWPAVIDRGPRYSGVFARFAPDGRALRLLDWNAHRARTAGAGTGLVAAMRPTEEDLVWFVTGVDEQGVQRAAKALNARDLRDAFAVAVTGEGVVKLPLEPRR